MKKKVLVALVITFLCVIPATWAQPAPPPEDTEGLCNIIKNQCIQQYWLCRIGTGTCPVACSFLDPAETFCAEQYGWCLDENMPWYCGIWAF